MTRRPRRNHTPVFKAKVALAAIPPRPPSRAAGSFSGPKSDMSGSPRQDHFAIHHPYSSKWTREYHVLVYQHIEQVSRPDFQCWLNIHVLTNGAVCDFAESFCK